VCVDCQHLITPENGECLFDPEQLCRECWFKKHPEVAALCPECEVHERKPGGEVLSTMRYSVIKGKTPQCYMCFNLGLDWDKPNKVLIHRSLLCSFATCSLWLL
jgi:hypothetical protein